MTHPAHSLRRPLVVALFALLAWVVGPSAQADPLYTITDIGTAPAMNASIATGLNNQGQVVGYSYSTAYPVDTLAGGSSTQTPFLYSDGQWQRFTSPILGGGLPTSINNSGQVAGGVLSSINDAGQTTDPAVSINAAGQGISPLIPGYIQAYALSNSGEMVGRMEVSDAAIPGGIVFHPVVISNGQSTDLFSLITAPANATGLAFAVNQNGDVLFFAQPGPNSTTTQDYLYQASTGRVTTLTGAIAGSGGLNGIGQVVVGNLLYDAASGKYSTLSSLIPPASGWSNLSATGINDLGQIIGQGEYQGQTVAFLMTPESVETPEPRAMAVWSTLALTLMAFGRTLRGGRREVAVKV